MLVDMFFQRYGWDWHTYEAQPEWLIEELVQVVRAEGVHHTLTQRRDHQGFLARTAPPPSPDRTREQLISEAAAAGFDVPGPS